MTEAIRPVRLLAAGGTIAMRGEHATPELDAEGLIAAVPELSRVSDLEAQTLHHLPGPQEAPANALEVARTAIAAADAGTGVVVTHGTDTLEEAAFLADVMYASEAPIVFTGAMRPASAVGADGPANLLDAAALAASREAAGLGVLVSFAGEVHAARAVRKADATGPAAFASPRGGPVGRVAEGRVTVWGRPERRPPVVPSKLDGRVEVVTAGLGSDGALVQAALAAGADGLVAVLLGAGHAPTALFHALAAAAETIPVVATCRPERGAILHETYGFEGSERDLRASAVIPAGALSPAAARMKLLACLGAGLDRAGIAAAFAPDDD